MPKYTATDFQPEVMKLFDKYVHGIIDRRSFQAGARKYAATGVSATALLEILNPKFAEAQVINADDPRVKTKFVEFDSPNGHRKGRKAFSKLVQTERCASFGGCGRLNEIVSGEHR